jgi:putative transposase
MTNYRRLYVKGGTYFFTVVTQKRRPIFSEGKNIQILGDVLRSVKEIRPFQVVSIVILPDHIHCIWTLPRDDHDYSERWKGIKYRFSLSFKKSFPTTESMNKKKEKGLWQRRFWEHHIRDQDDFNRHVDYIHYNPVKHNLARRALDWPHSSFKRFVMNGRYEKNWGNALPSNIKGMELD